VIYGEHLDLVAAENGGTFIPQRTCGVPILTSSYTHDTILRLREASGIPQMQYFGMFITAMMAWRRQITPPSILFTASSLPVVELWIVPCCSVATS
jgi:hypothetical protein